MKQKLLLIFGLIILTFSSGKAQQLITGKISEKNGSPIVGATILEKGSSNGTSTNGNGAFSLKVNKSKTRLVISSVGFQTMEIDASPGTEVSLVLEESSVNLDAVQVVGTRSLNRSATETPVPVDIIPIQQVTNSVGQVDLNQILQYVAPSFNSNRQTGSDGADHVDPATLRGLGPDQTLVLINGKRRHQSALIYLFGTRGRGNTGTDLNTIPASAIDRIEILRDGAAAQYGSDAIAGVINIVLKTDVEKLTGGVNTGIYDKGDGKMINAYANYGVKVGEKGVVNFTVDYLGRGKTNRPSVPDGPRAYFGDASAQNTSVFVNSKIPVGQKSEFYFFGGYSYRFSDSYAWTRTAKIDTGDVNVGTMDNPRNVKEIYPNGFTPRIQATINDASGSVGLRTKFGAWDADFNTTYGSNRFHYTVDGTLNASLGVSSPTHFDAGGFGFSQHTIGANFTRNFADIASGFNLAFGSEFRRDAYDIVAGEEGSWKQYPTADNRPGGSQGFPGFQPSNVLDVSRTNIAGYLDTELDVTKHFLVSGAVRFENYSDFGSTFNYKLATRLKLSDAISFRGSYSTGFRAPSLAQRYFNTTFTNFAGGVAVDQIIANNESVIAQTVGIPKLKQETSQNASIGFTAKPASNFNVTVDAYLINIKDRIVLTGTFSDQDDAIGSILKKMNVGNAQFFTNALDTKTYGLDVILTHQAYVGSGRLTTSFAGNFNSMELGTVKTTAKLAGKEDTYLDAREKAFILASAPKSKLNLTLDYKIHRFNTNLRLVHFAAVDLVNYNYVINHYSAKMTTDLAFGYELSKNYTLSIGSTNIFDVYPDKQDPFNTETGGMWDPVQMGSAGRFYFARLRFKF